jgi:hypothetical protein
MTISTHKTSFGSTNRSFSITYSSSLAEGNEQSLKFGTEYSYSEPGNIIPHFWFKKILDEKGRPDLTAITLLAEIFALYRFSSNSASCSYSANRSCDQTTLIGKTLRTSYDHFTEKFMLRKEKARRGFLRLEELNIICRGVCNISLGDGVRCNKLMITLNQDFFNSCFRSPDLDIRGQKDDFSFSPVKNAQTECDAKDNKDNLSSTSYDDSKIQSIQISYHPISNKNIKKDRSMKSNFLQNSFFKKEEGGLRTQTNFTSSPVQLKAPVLQLKDFYPLSTEDANHLQSKSGREFSLNAMNEILLDMSKRVKDRLFRSKKGFLSYMSKVFTYEKRDACRISGEGFRIKANRTTEEITAQKQEEFLSQIEYSLQVSPEWHLRKKLCAVLDLGKAYNLLSSYKHCRLNGDTFEIHLNKHVELTNMDRNIILNQVKASHESADLATGNFISISALKIIAPPPISKTSASQTVGEGRVKGTTGPAFESLGIWGKIRKALILHNGEKGEALDQAWFSKLMPEIDEQNKIIKLKAPTELIKDWISRNYMQVLERYLGKEQYSYEIC